MDHPSLDPRDSHAARLGADGLGQPDEQGQYKPRRVNEGGPDDFNASVWDVPLRRQPAEE